MTATSLPPLPPSVDEVRAMFRGEFDYARPGNDYYLATQMREYAIEAIAQHKPTTDAEAGQYAIKVLERKIESLSKAMEINRQATDPGSDGYNWHARGLFDGLQIAVNALTDEARFVKLERGALALHKTE